MSMLLQNIFPSFESDEETESDNEEPLIQRVQQNQNQSHNHQEEEKDSCPICMEEFNSVNILTFNCGHKIHFSCYMEYFTSTALNNQKCMLCRGEIYENNTRSKLNGMIRPQTSHIIRPSYELDRPVLERRPSSRLQGIMRIPRVERLQQSHERLRDQIERRPIVEEESFSQRWEQIMQQSEERMREQRRQRERRRQQQREQRQRRDEPVNLRILETIGSGSLKLKEIMERANLTKGVANRLLKGLLRSRRVVRFKVGRGFQYVRNV